MVPWMVPLNKICYQVDLKLDPLHMCPMYIFASCVTIMKAAIYSVSTTNVNNILPCICCAVYNCLDPCLWYMCMNSYAALFVQVDMSVLVSLIISFQRKI